MKTTAKKMKLPSMILLGFIGAVVISMSCLYGATPISQEVSYGICAECHDDVCADFKLVRHAEIQTEKWTETAQQVETLCANCHGDPTKHLDEGGGVGTIFAFKKTDDVQAKTTKCLNCHSRTRARFFASPHGKAAMDCTNCHSDLMSATPGRKRPSKVCVTCHEDIADQFQLNERHRLQEGIMECTTCHDQHAPSTGHRLGGFKHESCLKCHTDKGGPFLYEHEASRIEGCTACHEVHGSPNKHMLTLQSVSDLCFSCHGMAPSFHARFDSYSTNCTVCHATVHGSNLSKIFLK